MDTHDRSSRSWVPMLILVGCVLAPILFVAGMIVGAKIVGEITLTADSLSSWVTALATVAITLLTFILAKETWHLRNAQIDQLNELRKESMRPHVVVNVQPSMVSITFWDVVVQNIGKGLAKNVRFRFEKTDGTDATKENSYLAKTFSKLSIFEKGCSSLGINQSISSFLFGFGDLEKEVGKDQLFEQRVRINITYEDIEGEKYCQTTDIDFSDYKGVSTLGGSTNPTYSIFKELEKIRQTLEPVFKSGSKRLMVETFNSPDRKRGGSVSSERDD